MLPHNTTFAREGRCLLFAEYSQSLRDCRGCRTIAWCRYYDRADLREPDRLALARWEDDGAPPLETYPPLLSLFNDARGPCHSMTTASSTSSP